MKLLTMNQKHRFWLLAIVIATVGLSSCADQNGVAPAEGEMHNAAGY
jgi:hypothetical protein